MIIFLLLFFCGTMIVSVLVYFKKIYQKTNSKELLIFSRYPTPGTTKTRLIPKLGEECASYVQLLMVCILFNFIDMYFCNHTIAHGHGLPCVWWLCFFYLFVQSKNGKMLFCIWFYQTSEKNTYIIVTNARHIGTRTNRHQDMSALTKTYRHRTLDKSAPSLTNRHFGKILMYFHVYSTFSKK